MKKWCSSSFFFFALLKLGRSQLPPHVSVHEGEPVSVSVSWCSCTHVSGGIFIWLSTIRHSELNEIIHISIISLPLCGPLLPDLQASPAFPRPQRFIPAAAAICISPGYCCTLDPKKKRTKWGQCKVRLGVIRSQCKHRTTGALKVPWGGWWLACHLGRQQGRWQLGSRFVRSSNRPTNIEFTEQLINLSPICLLTWTALMLLHLIHERLYRW